MPVQLPRHILPGEDRLTLRQRLQHQLGPRDDLAPILPPNLGMRFGTFGLHAAAIHRDRMHADMLRRCQLDAALRIAAGIGMKIQPMPLGHLVQPLRQHLAQRVNRVIPNRQTPLLLIGIRQLQGRLPTKAIRTDFPRGHHQMRMMIALIAFLARQVDRPIDRHPITVRDLTRPSLNQLLPLFGRHRIRQRQLHLARSPRIAALLGRLRRIPKFFAAPSAAGWAATLRHLDAGRDHPDSGPYNRAVVLSRAHR